MVISFVMVSVVPNSVTESSRIEGLCPPVVIVMIVIVMIVSIIITICDHYHHQNNNNNNNTQHTLYTYQHLQHVPSGTFL